MLFKSTQVAHIYYCQKETGKEIRQKKFYFRRKVRISLLQELENM